jgi:hypothetical protein
MHQVCMLENRNLLATACIPNELWDMSAQSATAAVSTEVATTHFPFL